MWEILRLCLRHLRLHKGLVLILSLSVSIPLMCYLVLNGAVKEITARYGDLSQAFLVVEEAGSTGEFFGSRLPAQTAASLLAGGASLVVPEIRTVTGTKPEDMLLLRGVTLEAYLDIEPIRLLAGRPLEPNNQPRRVMVGERLARDRGAYPGSVLSIRGRDFEVQAVFSTGTYSDYEAWISLQDAQQLLGWSDEVSIFIIPAGEMLKAGDLLPGGAVVIQKGESGTNLVAEFRDLFNVLEWLAVLVGLSSAVTLANTLWRMAWQQRRQLAVLQAVGFKRRSLMLYLVGQGVFIVVLGFALGLVESVLVSHFSRIQTTGMAFRPSIDGRSILLSMAFALGVLVLSTALPVAWLARLNLAGLLRSE